MSGDFFGALLRRAMSPPAVRPRLASRFEGDAGVMPDEPHERVDAPATNPKPPMVSAQHESATGDAALEPQVTQLTAAPHFEAIAPIATVPPRADRTRDAAPPDTPKPRRSRAAEKEVPALALVVPLAPAPAAGPSPARVVTPPPVVERVVRERIEHQQTNTLRSLIESRITERLTVEPARVQSAPLITPSAVQVQRQGDATTPPSIEIHIGRIEVLPAPVPPAAQRHVEEAQPPKAQSLDAYLAQRRRP